MYEVDGSVQFGILDLWDAELVGVEYQVVLNGPDVWHRLHVPVLGGVEGHAFRSHRHPLDVFMLLLDVDLQQWIVPSKTHETLLGFWGGYKDVSRCFPYVSSGYSLAELSVRSKKKTIYDQYIE